MTRQEINEKLNSVFREVFDDDSITVTDDTTAADIEDWDSLAHMTLISTVEEAFDIEFSLGEINAFENVGEMMNSIENHLE
ncbi:MAG: acyl carrier protein [Oscillospiraceae bacterium]